MNTLPVAPYIHSSATSYAAAQEIDEHLNALQRQVLTRIQDTGGQTDEEIQDYLELNPSTERPRRIELLRKGLILDSGVTRKTKSGRAATVWIPRQFQTHLL